MSREKHCRRARIVVSLKCVGKFGKMSSISKVWLAFELKKYLLLVFGSRRSKGSSSKEVRPIVCNIRDSAKFILRHGKIVEKEFFQKNMLILFQFFSNKDTSLFLYLPYIPAPSFIKFGQSQRYRTDFIIITISKTHALAIISAWMICSIVQN